MQESMRMTTDTTDALLNIKQAAKMLNVSEISLRRWSDSGKLPCLRIGTRRARRVRLNDLLAYLEEKTLPADNTTTSNKIGRIAQIVLEGISIDYGTHLCAFYETDPGRLKLAMPFLLDGLQNNERCFMVATHEGQTCILEALREMRPSIEQDITDGYLVITDGLSSVDEMYTFFEESFLKANRHGFQGLRVLGDMAWALHKNVSIEELSRFEIRYNNGLGHRFPVVSLCQYDARLFSGTAVLNALKSHDNTYCYPLNHFLGV